MCVCVSDHFHPPFSGPVTPSGFSPLATGFSDTTSETRLNYRFVWYYVFGITVSETMFLGVRNHGEYYGGFEAHFAGLWWKGPLEFGHGGCNFESALAGKDVDTVAGDGMCLGGPKLALTQRLIAGPLQCLYFLVHGVWVAASDTPTFLQRSPVANISNQ